MDITATRRAARLTLSQKLSTEHFDVSPAGQDISLSIHDEDGHHLYLLHEVNIDDERIDERLSELRDLLANVEGYIAEEREHRRFRAQFIARDTNPGHDIYREEANKQAHRCAS